MGKLGIIIERLLPDHYTKTLVGSVVDQAVFTQLVQVILPTLHAHLDKLYMDLSTVSVSWFVCLFLNSIPIRVAVRLLDGFFIDGPKFLFWVALAILKFNEKALVSRGRDEDIFVNILKDFFQRLGADGMGSMAEQTSSEPNVTAAPSDSENGAAVTIDPSSLSGYPLFVAVLNLAYSFSNVVTNEVVEGLRCKTRMKVVHQMEATSRRSQIRSLCEQVSMSEAEVGIVYDTLRILEFGNEEDEQGIDSPVGASIALRLEEERKEMESIGTNITNAGAWGFISRKRQAFKTPKAASKSGEVTPSTSQQQKSIKLQDFRKVYQKLGPWKSSMQEELRSKNNVTNIRNSTQKPAGGRKPQQTIPSVSNHQPNEDIHLNLVDRIYFYCSFNYTFFHHQKPAPQGGMGAEYMAQSGSNPNSSDSSSGSNAGGIKDSNYMVDLASIVHILDIMLKQALHSRLRFLFELHDIDGDGFLNKSELKAVMDSLMEIFETNTSDPEGKGRSNANNKLEDTEAYMKALSSFMSTALKMGNNKGVQSLTNGTDLLSLSTSSNIRKSSVASPSLKPSVEENGDVDLLGEDIKLSIDPNFSSSQEVADVSKRPTTSHGETSSRNPPVKERSTRSGSVGQIVLPSRQASSPNSDSDLTFRLSFNEFLLAVLSQSVFVHFFEKVNKL
jgi:hypothetical protein